jgi:nitrogen fixation protein FixH
MKKKSRWGYGIAGVYIFFALATLGFVIFSRFHQMDLVTKKYYEEELQYQDHIDRSQRTQSLSKALEWEYNATAKIIILKFPADNAVKGISGKIMFFRPSDAAQDLIVPIELSTEGHQLVSASHLSKGMWRMKIFWNAAETEYYSEEILVIE